MTTTRPSAIPESITSAPIREFVEEWAAITEPDRIELIGPEDDGRLIGEALADGTLLPAGEGRYYSRSYVKDTARTEERTVVATADPSDAGAYNNWKPNSEVIATITERMRGASKGKTMYVVPYLMAAPGSPLEQFAAGVELTDDRNVVLQMIRMARVGLEHVANLEDPDNFVRGVHVVGDLPNLGQGTDEDLRLFATIPDRRMILHFGSAYGGNALLGKIAHGLRLASHDGWKNGFLADQFLLLGITDRETGKKYHVAGGFPSASGKTNLAMTLAPDGLGDRYHVEFYGDDITWMWRDGDGRLRGMNPEYGAFGIAKDTNRDSNPTALESIAPGTGTIFTNVAYNEKTRDVWWEGLTPEPPADPDGWLDWKGEPIAERAEEDKGAPWAHPNSRFTTQLANLPNLAEEYANPEGVIIDAIIFGGRTRDREPLVRALPGYVEGVYDGLTLGAEATFAAEGLDGKLRYDPMSMRPFMSYGEGDYARHWLDVIGSLSEKPAFAHVNWFQRDPEDGRFLWPGYRENLRALLWLMQWKAGEVEGNPTPVGVLPTAEELDLTGLEIDADDLDRVLTIDRERWRREIGFRSEHLAQFDRLPREITDVHERLAKALSE